MACQEQAVFRPSYSPVYSLLWEASFVHNTCLLYTSKAAFYRQRKKIREVAFRNLLLAFNRKLAKKLYNGKYEFWACDGSSCDILLNPEDKDTYFEPNGKSTRCV